MGGGESGSGSLMQGVATALNTPKDRSVALAGGRSQVREGVPPKPTSHLPSTETPKFVSEWFEVSQETELTSLLENVGGVPGGVFVVFPNTKNAYEDKRVRKSSTFEEQQINNQTNKDKYVTKGGSVNRWAL